MHYQIDTRERASDIQTYQPTKPCQVRIYYKHEFNIWVFVDNSEAVTDTIAIKMDGKSETNHLENLSKAMNKARDFAILVMTFILYKVARSLLLSVQKFTWAVTGIEGKRRSAKKGLNFKQSAHVQDIKWRRKIVVANIADPSDFVTVHNCFKHPSYVLHSNVSLYCITKEEAVFVETPDDINIYSKKMNQYLYKAQFYYAKRLISMPLASFHKIAQDLGDPRIPVVWVSSTGQCGSTMFSNIFATLPGTILLAEPDALTNLSFLRKSKVSEQGEYEQLLASSVRLLCKPDDRAGMVCIKTRHCCAAQMRDLSKYFPKHRYIFLYRNSMKTVSSYLSLFTSEPIPRSVKYIADNSVLSTILPCFRRYLYYYTCYVLDDDTAHIKPSSMSTVGMFTRSWAAAINRCSEATEKGIRVLPMLYDDVMKNPRRTCSVLFEQLGIRSQYVSLALEAFKVDFQKGSGMIGQDSRKLVTHDMRVEADAILKLFNLPKLGERYEINGLVDFDSHLSRVASRDKLL
ncbi:hypothetical protein ScPMuIL_015059 [Solemya velum]